jgi:hypothetical protein
MPDRDRSLPDSPLTSTDEIFGTHNAGRLPEGGGSHRIAVGCAAEPFTDPDGFVCETTAPATLS